MDLNLKSAVSASKQALESVGNKVSGTHSFFVSELKWAATALSVVLAGSLLVPLLRKIPFLASLQGYGVAIAGIVLMLVAGFLAMLNFGVAQFLSAGLGIAGAISVMSAVLAQPIAKAQSIVGVV